MGRCFAGATTKLVVWGLLIAGCCGIAVWQGHAQSSDLNSASHSTVRSRKTTQAQGNKPADTNPQSQAQRKAPRVWDNESIQEIQGGINVVGTSKASGAVQPGRNLAKATAPVKRPTNRAPAPNFRATTIDGTEYTNASLLGKIVLVQIWTTWCPHCRADQPAVDKIARAYSDKLVVLAVDDSEPSETVKRYLQVNPRSCEVILSKDTDLVKQLGGSGYPHYVAIDREGNIAGTLSGEAGETRLRALLNRAAME